MEKYSANLLKELETIIATKTVVGETINVDGILIVPFIDVRLGLGSGGAEKERTDKNNAFGMGAGLSLEPSAVLVVNKDNVQLVNIKNQDSLNKIIDMVPNILSKFGLDKDTTKEKDVQEEE